MKPGVAQRKESVKDVSEQRKGREPGRMRNPERRRRCDEFPRIPHRNRRISAMEINPKGEQKQRPSDSPPHGADYRKENSESTDPLRGDLFSSAKLDGD